MIIPIGNDSCADISQIKKFIDSTFPKKDPKPAEASVIDEAELKEVTKKDVINSEKAAQSEATWDLSTLLVPFHVSENLTNICSLYGHSCISYALFYIRYHGTNYPLDPQTFINDS